MKKENDKKLEKTDLNRVVMFNPSKINHFSFEIGNVRHPIYEKNEFNDKENNNDNENENINENYIDNEISINNHNKNKKKS